jgi:dTDP-glucose pyrophosphorylase
MILVLPMAGRGSRFSNVGYSTPKPLIEVNGFPMIYHAFQSFKGVEFTKIIFITLREHEARFKVSEILRSQVVKNFEIVELEEVTEGQLCTVLAAKEFLRKGESLLIAASDSFVESNIDEDIKKTDLDGLISVINLPGDQWSFAKTDEKGRVIEVSEKVRISDNASTGIYYFKDAGLFLEEAETMIRNKEKTRGEYYIMPLYNKLIAKGYNIGVSLAKSMWDMGTPEAKSKFEEYLNGTKI